MNLTKEQIDYVAEWMDKNSLSNGTVGKFKGDFYPKQEPAQAAVQSKKVNNNMENQEIKIGDRVLLKGDSNSPEMTVIGNSSQDARYQYAAIGKGVKENTIQNDDILKCAWFPKNEEEEGMVLNRPMQTVEIHKDALEKLIPVQPSNKK